MKCIPIQGNKPYIKWTYLSSCESIESKVLSDVILTGSSSNINFVTQQKDRTRRKLLIPQETLPKGK